MNGKKKGKTKAAEKIYIIKNKKKKEKEKTNLCILIREYTIFRAR